eukprot:9399057-Alexandrium_andersonii.AAC.1
MSNRPRRAHPTTLQRAKRGQTPAGSPSRQVPSPPPSYKAAADGDDDGDDYDGDDDEDYDD